MNFGPLIYLGVLIGMVGSFWGLIVVPQLQLGREDVRVPEGAAELYPNGRLGLAKEGAHVYRSLGCVECHTQQVRPEGFGSDIERGWGVRRTVALDYLLDDPVLLGRLRMGPDLANVGARRPEAAWHLRHLYAPKSESPKSTMPGNPFLMERLPIRGETSTKALVWSGEAEPEAGYENVPTERAEALAAYLGSVQSGVSVFEAPLPPEPEEEEAPPAPPAGHHWSRAIARATPVAHKGATAGANVVAATMLDLIQDQQLVEESWRYFREEQSAGETYVPFISDDDPQAIEKNVGIMSEYRERLREYYYDPSKYDTYLEQLSIDYPQLKDPDAE
jgi:cbb3-type cytochrome c oxidase subunit II